MRVFIYLLYLSIYAPAADRCRPFLKRCTQVILGLIGARPIGGVILERYIKLTGNDPIREAGKKWSEMRQVDKRLRGLGDD